ncbi:MAG: hypothetical protein J6M06_01580 [Synergistaceae bacterium]|nr:hypothetical protein [Synergistaceae bacterium]
MIRMINGSTRIGLNLYTAASGPFDADAATEKRLVSLGVAEYVTEKSPTPTETGAPAASSAGAGTSNPEETNSTEGEETGERTLDPEQLRTLSNAQLKKLAEDMGLDTSKMKVKEDFVAAITSVSVDADEDEDESDENDENEEPPALGAEEPEV